MYERIDAPAGVIAVKFGESLKAEEVTQLYADVGEALEKHQRLNYFVDASNWSHVDPDAAFEGVKQRLLHLGWLQRFDRVAIVTGSPFVQAMLSMFGSVAPGMEVRSFAPTQAEQAFSWVKNG